MDAQFRAGDANLAPDCILNDYFSHHGALGRELEPGIVAVVVEVEAEDRGEELDRTSLNEPGNLGREVPKHREVRAALCLLRDEELYHMYLLTADRGLNRRHRELIQRLCEEHLHYGSVPVVRRICHC